MVYRGKPSRACLECRVKRRKCDLSRPECRQCVRAGSRCDGYRQGDSHTFRDQTVDVINKMQPSFDNSRPLYCLDNTQTVSGRSRSSQQAMAYQFMEQSAYGLWYSPAISIEHQAQTFFFNHYVINRPGKPTCHPDSLAIIHARAQEHGYLANMINAVGLRSLAYLGNVPTMTYAASRMYSLALRGIYTALGDPAEATSDEMLVAVMLLILYETVTCNSNEKLSSQDRHIEGALALIELRGVGQLHNRVGRSLFLSLRTQILINCLQRKLSVPNTLTNYISEARKFETAQEVPAGHLAALVINVCAVLAAAKQEPVNKANLSRSISAILAIDKELVSWTKKLISDYEYKTKKLANDFGEPYYGRHYTYSSPEMVYNWNLQRCARITLHEALIELITRHCSSPPTSYETLLHVSDATIMQNIKEICCSLTYILHFCDKPGESVNLKATYLVPMLWPLSIAGTAHTTTDTMREWVIAQLKKIEQVTGIQTAKFSI